MDVNPCPLCGSLPCDWVDDPHKAEVGLCWTLAKIREVLGVNEKPMMDELPQIIAARIAAEQSQATTLAALEAENERLEAGVRKFLEMLEHGYAPNIEGALAEAMCCSGQMCGCRGASVGEYLAHLLRSDVGINRVNSAALSDLIADTAGYPEPNITLTGGDHG